MNHDITAAVLAAEERGRALVADAEISSKKIVSDADKRAAVLRDQKLASAAADRAAAKDAALTRSAQTVADGAVASKAQTDKIRVRAVMNGERTTAIIIDTVFPGANDGN